MDNDKSLITFDKLQAEVKLIQDIANKKICDILSQCENEVCINVMPTYLSHVDKKDGYPIQLHIWKDNIIPQPNYPVFGKGINPLLK